MPVVLPHIEWAKELQYNWTSEEGQSRLKNIVTPFLTFEPHLFQLYDSACILSGRDIFCISATGDGKSALIYMPALARPQMITMVIEPTNILEVSMVSVHFNVKFQVHLPDARQQACIQKV